MEKGASLFFFGDTVAPTSVRGISFETLHKHGCQLCPLHYQKGFKPEHPQMQPYGSEKPVVYMLGEAPGADEDHEGMAFVGRAGKYLRQFIPRRWNNQLRWNNCVRTRPKNNETPSTVAIECCRPSIIQDIERSKPKAIFGFGNIPLNWATGQSGITKWNGRRMPIKVGQHHCWYFALLHPSYILHLDNPDMQKKHEEMSFVFQLDLKRAFDLVERLPEPKLHTRQDAEKGIDCLHNLGLIEEAFERLAKEKFLGVDIETKGTRPYNLDAKILSIAFAGKEEAIAFPLHHKEARWTAKELDRLEEMLAKFLHHAEGRKVIFTGFELEWLAYFYGDDLIYAGKWGDAQAQAFLLDGREGALSLEFLCLQFFGLNVKAINNTDRNNLDQTPIDTVLEYNAIDAKYHRQLYLAQAPLIRDAELSEVYYHHMRRLQSAILMQLKGVPVEQSIVEELAEKYESRIKEIEKEIEAEPLAQQFKDKFKHKYRPSAPKDTKDVFKMIGVFLDKATEELVEKIDHPLAKLHLRWKEAAKVLSTYILPIRANNPESCLFPDGMLHPQLHLHKTRTWRSSSREPNIQNFPKHYGESHEVRDAVRPPLGHKVVSFDWGQIQARNVAMESKDSILVQSFWDRHDIHADWRDRVFQLYPKWPKEGLKKVLADKKLLKYYRNRAKNAFVFASFFGAGGKKVANTLGVPENIGYKLAEEFDAAFPELTDWQNGLHDHYDAHGYVTGLSGFRRYAPVAHTEIINTPIQSDEAIMVFDGMIRLCEMQEPCFVPNLMIHDDITFIWPAKDVDRNAEVVISTLLDCPYEWAHIVPLSVEMSIGGSWDHMEEVGAYESDKWEGKLR